MANVPTNLSTSLVTGRFVLAVDDRTDSGDRPDAIPAIGCIVFTASVPYIPMPTATDGPVTIMFGEKPDQHSFIGVIDDEGYLCTPHPTTGEPMYRGLRLVCTDDSDMLVSNWTWKAEYKFKNGRVDTHSFALPAGADYDLTTLVKVPSSPGVGIPQYEAAIIRAEEMVDEATNAAEGALNSAERAEDAADRAEAPTDEMVSNLMENHESLTFKSLNDGVFESNGVLIVERFTENGDSDDETWQRTIDYAVANGGGFTIKGTRNEYFFRAPVNPLGLKNSILMGLGKYETVIRAAEGSGDLLSAFHVPSVSSSDELSNVKFTKLRFDGSMSGSYTGHVRDRTFDDDRISSAIFLSGNGVPTETSNPKISNIIITDCSFIGMESLPVHIRGASFVDFNQNHLVRCLDPGFIHTETLYATKNRSEWSADNGLSISRGCTNIYVLDNIIQGSFFAGIHVGGFDDEAGPRTGLVRGNIVKNSAMYGISAEEGSCDLLITENIIDGVKRGVGTWASDSNSILYGSGILVGGVHSDSTNEDNFEGYSSLAENNRIINNVVVNAERFGIVWYGVDGLTVIDNEVLDVGSSHMVDGTTVIVDDNKFRNIAVGPFTPRSGSTKNVRVRGNLISDRRSPSITNYGIYDRYGISDRSDNLVLGTRNSYADPDQTGLGGGMTTDGGEGFMARLDMKVPARIGLLGDSTGDKRTEWFNRGIQQIIDSYPYSEGFVYSEFYWDGNSSTGGSGYKRHRLVPIGRYYDEFDKPGNLDGNTSSSGHSWSASPGWDVSGGSATSSDTSSAFLSVPSNHPGFGRRISGRVRIDTATASSERGVNFEIGSGENNRIVLKIAVSPSGVLFGALTKVIDGVVSGVTSSLNPIENEPTGSVIELPFSLEIETSRVAAYVGADSGAFPLTSAEFDSLGGLDWFGMRMQSTVSGVDILRVGVSDRVESPHLVEAYNGSKAGSTLSDLLPDLDSLFPYQMNAVIYSSSHNYLSDTADRYLEKLSGVIRDVRSKHPGSGVVISSQNPEYEPNEYGFRVAHNQYRLPALRSFASALGYGYIPVAEAFSDRLDGGRSLVGSDGVHPLQAGADLWAKLFENWAKSKSLRP